jgi:hypothetical protein
VETALIRKRKLKGDIAEWGAYRLAEDEHGTWLFVPKGTAWNAFFADGRTASVQVGQGDNPEGCDVMFLVSREPVWWFPQWWSPGAFPWTLTVDICEPLSIVDGVAEYLDLEVDLFVLAAGGHGIADFDEFIDAHDADLIADARYTEVIAATAAVERALRARAEPFGEVGRAHFARGVSLGLDPIG